MGGAKRYLMLQTAPMSFAKAQPILPVVSQFEILRAAALMILRAPMMTKATRP
jgi:hypothetical protein